MMRRALIVLSVLGVALFLALGVWQVERLRWKTALIAEVTHRLWQAPVAATPEGGPEYSRLKVWGRYGAADIKVKAVTALGAGYWVMTPLTTAQGWKVWINRGFVAEGVSPLPPPAHQEIVGLLRLTQAGGGFLRANDPVAGRWFSRDTGAMSAAEGITTVPWFLDAEAGEAAPLPGQPIPGQTVVAFPNHHLQYALTWFALALLLSGAAWWNLGRDPKSA